MASSTTGLEDAQNSVIDDNLSDNIQPSLRGNFGLYGKLFVGLSPNRSREGTAQIYYVCVSVCLSVCLFICVSVRHHLNNYVSETN